MPQTLHPTKIDVPDNLRAAAIDLLNARLADGVDLSSQMKQAHWNVKGPGFIALHALFDTVHGAVQVHVDDMAERIAALGGTARGTAAVAASASTLPEYPLEIAEAAEIGDADTEDLFVSVSRDVDKNLWLVEAHAQAER